MRNLNTAQYNIRSDEDDDEDEDDSRVTNSQYITFPEDGPFLVNNNHSIPFENSNQIISYNNQIANLPSQHFANNPSNCVSNVPNISDITVAVSHFYGLHTIRSTGDPNGITQVLNTGVIRWSTCGTMTLAIALGLILSLGAILAVILLIYGVIYIASLLISGLVSVAIVAGIIYCLMSTSKVALTQMSSQNGR